MPAAAVRLVCVGCASHAHVHTSHTYVCVPPPSNADGECEEVYGEAHVLALGSYTKEW